MQITSPKGNLRTIAYEVIKKKIIDCELMPGSLIDEKKIIEEIGTSRTPIREALSKLENENLVNIYPKRGIFVTNITVKDVIDIYTVREAIEPLAARLAAPNIDLKELELFYQIYSNTQHKYTLDEHIQIDRRFHTLVANSSENQHLAQCLLRLYDQNSRIRTLSKLRVKERLMEARKEHFELVKCFMNKDAKNAERIMKIHISNGKKAALKIV